MNILDLLKIKSLDGAKLIAGKNGISNEINSVNVLEAIDIENWGRSGQVILTSLFALKNLSNSELNVFFKKLHDIGISAIIVKIERLVQHIPDEIVHLCDKHLIPLIQIDKKVKYESIILEILEPIINRNVYLLNKYYEVHSEITRIALKMPSMDSILREFKKMINRDLSLINTVKGTQIGTNPELYDFTIINKLEVEKQKYMYYTYERNEVVYNVTNPKTVGKQIRVRIPYLEFDEYELIIHELSSPISAEDFMVLENAVKFLQMELLKKHALSQNIFQQKNSIISDLLNGRLHEKKDIDEVLEYLNIYKHRYYQVVLIKLNQKVENKPIEKNFPQILRHIKQQFRFHFNNIAFLKKTNRIVFISNFEENEKIIHINSIKEIMQQLDETDLLKDFYYHISISSEVEKKDIPKANGEVLDTQKILDLFYKPNTILGYEDLGIYRLFLESNNLEELEKFISPNLTRFREDYPELFDTLATFLDTNQNYLRTSEKLFLHPKTVRYRIDKIKNMLSMEFNNPEEIMHIQIAARLFKLIE
ncbi:PucR family transcriptional regulator [Wukongibacter sp. M2B1]|uniref:PucR family transcriptional regulator n=1 Tax=Wukongibacter sp. M2B1 TaxID=3088895 RepID=UPI003D79AEAB